MVTVIGRIIFKSSKSNTFIKLESDKNVKIICSFVRVFFPKVIFQTADDIHEFLSILGPEYSKNREYRP